MSFCFMVMVSGVIESIREIMMKLYNSVGPNPQVVRTFMAERGITRPFTGALQQWSYDPLAEADRIAAELIRRGIVAPGMLG